MTFVEGVTRSSLILILATFATVLNAAPSGAGVASCSYNANTKTVTATPSPDSEVLVMVIDMGHIHASETDCGAATRFNTDKVIVNDLPGRRLEVVLSLAGGRFRPGFTNEPGSSDEIEFVFNLGAGPVQTVDVRGTDGEDFFRAGSSNGSQPRVNLNANERRRIDSDVVVRGELYGIILEGFGGNDVLGGTGGVGTGGVYQELLLLGGDAGADRLRGGDGEDVVDGTAGRDLVVGGRGGDDVLGGGGPDTIKAGQGADTLYGGPSDDDLVGGPGEDSCNDTQGDNTFESCESINEM